MTTELYFPNLQNPLVKLHTPFPGKPTIFVAELLGLPGNWLTIALLDAYTAVLDHIDNIYNNLEDSRKNIGGCLITTSTGKIFSNGVHLEESIDNPVFLKMLPLFLARLLHFRLPTIAAVNGHAFAGGFVLACAHDYIVMGNEKGYMCMNDVLIEVTVHSCLLEVIRTKISSPLVLNKTILEGHRYTADQAVKAGFVSKSVPNDKVMETAGELADSLSHLTLNKGYVFGLLKAEKNKNAIKALMENDLVAGSYLSKM
ncbi:hypothetical protein BB558_003584 [Smittium angustum]|uniref:Enoyl-CoA hydratase n=1 Tax=Smittium angustum TaxID=133377 RepID=A0A2U1J5P1_SMIAN|nr:hypothetical protein BB558_003584 [Smittium angustum]